jgi:hypothetical protein
MASALCQQQDLELHADEARALTLSDLEWANCRNHSDQQLTDSRHVLNVLINAIHLLDEGLGVKAMHPFCLKWCELKDAWEQLPGNLLHDSRLLAAIVWNLHEAWLEWYTKQGTSQLQHLLMMCQMRMVHIMKEALPADFPSMHLAPPTAVESPDGYTLASLHTFVWYKVHEHIGVVHGGKQAPENMPSQGPTKYEFQACGYFWHPTKPALNNLLASKVLKTRRVFPLVARSL